MMIVAMAFFAIADTLIKVAASTISPGHTSFFIIAGSLVVFLIMAAVQRAPLNDKRALTPIMLARYAAEIMAMLGMITSLSLIPLSTLGAILQATPLLVAGGAVIFLGEQVTWRRWSAIGVGFIGMLMIIRPGTAGFDTSILWALLAMLALSARDLLTRVVPKGIPTVSLATYTMIATLPFTVLWGLVTEGSVLPAQSPNWFVIAGMVGFGAFGYWLITAAVRIAEVSVVSPFRYSRLIFLLALGVVVFGERPDIMTLAGAALIIASGIYTMWRDRLKSRATPQIPA